MKFLGNAPPFLFFTGKGGAGKTWVACAGAIHRADAGQRVLLVSTDPVSNVVHAFDVAIGNHITPIIAVLRLAALEIDPQAAAAAYRERIVGPLRGLLPATVGSTIEEHLSGACTTEIAAFDEITALLTDPALTTGYEHVVFDTAPTGHTLLLLDVTGVYHREVTRQVSAGQEALTTPMTQLRDPAPTRFRLCFSVAHLTYATF